MQKKLLKTAQWYKLDNAAKVFPGQNSPSWSNIFRMSVSLKETVDPQVLEAALGETLGRFPCFDVRMRSGFFWHYLEKNPNGAPPVLPDIANPCHRMLWNENNRYLFRVYYYEKRISCEFHHSLTDAHGASRFVMTLVAVYLRMKGAEIPCGESVLNTAEQATGAELEDSFARFATSSVKAQRSKGNVYHFKGERLPKHHVNITTGYMPVDAVKAKAKERGVTVTELISAVLLYSMYVIQKEQGTRLKPLSVQIPVNLRNTFPSQTLRNFSLCYCVKIDPRCGDYTFDEVLCRVSHYLRYINNEKELNAMMTGNIALERNPIMRVLPLAVKDFFIGLAFKLTGEKTVSALFSNVGIIRAPQEMYEHINRVMLMTGPGVRNGSRCAGITFGDTLAVSVANIYESTAIQKELFTSLVKLGIPVKIESNRNCKEAGE